METVVSLGSAKGLLHLESVVIHPNPLSSGERECLGTR